DGVSLTLSKSQRLCLIGRNGAGKSSLLKIIAGMITADAGEIICHQNVKPAWLTQDVPEDITGSILNLMLSAQGQVGEALIRLDSLLHGSSTIDDNNHEINALQHTIDELDGWRVKQAAERICSRMNLDQNARFEALSGGMKRRVLLAKALMDDPEVLLLDEPTNHLDIESIQWLERFLLQFQGAIIFITHDREFLRKVATDIAELDRGKLISFPGNYERFLEQKENHLQAEAKQFALFDKKLAEEEAWIRQGIKARRTRNEGRVRALEAMRKERSKRRQVSGKINLDSKDSPVSGKSVITAEHISFSHQGRILFQDFSTKIERGDRIGILGPNGCGKSTLIQVLLKQLNPDHGSVEHGTSLNIAYFDQLRSQLDLQSSVLLNVTEGSDFIILNEQKIHAIGYLERFLFSPERAQSPVSSLSGGEKNRLLLAKLLSKPSNILVLDEPTNDLDIETLEVLEEMLSQYKGTILLVSHDRQFLDNVVTSTMAFEGNGIIKEYVGGFSDWLTQRPIELSREEIEKPSPKTAIKTARKPKLSFKQKRQLEDLPDEIENIEAQLETLQQQMGDPAFYQQSKSQILDAQTQLETLNKTLQDKYELWESLSEIEAQQ
ncbi:MAG: ATP-binding cassette domain-containing protein, partial [Francisellaceae bacterium]